LIRRGGSASVIKNCCFEKEQHELILSAKLNVLPYLLLPLCGPDEFDEVDMNGMPEEIQFLPPTKNRETDPAVLRIFLEALLLLTTERYGRDSLRDRQVYPVLRQLHLTAAANDESTAELIDRIVQMLQRDETTAEPAVQDTSEGITELD